jgi:hypothetical protein
VAREHILIPSARHRDPVSLVRIHVRRPELDRDEFQRRLLGAHATLVLGQAATRDYVRRYAQLHTIGTTQEDRQGERIDAVSVFAFASLNDVEDYLVSDDHHAVAASEEALAGDGSEWWTAIGDSVINRLAPEIATPRDA